MLTALLLAAAEYDPKTHVQDVLLMGTKDAPVLTMHMVTLALSGLITVALLLLVSKSIATGQSGEGNARYLTKSRLGQFVEAMICWLRDEMIEPVLGTSATKRWLPLLFKV